MPELPGEARWLGYAGLLPQAALLMAMLALDPMMAGAVLATGCVYAALILSFLGGVWWGLALLSQTRPRWTYRVAVLPSLFAFATVMPTMLGATGWQMPGLALGAALMVSPLIDEAIARSAAYPRAGSDSAGTCRWLWGR